LVGPADKQQNIQPFRRYRYTIITITEWKLCTCRWYLHHSSSFHHFIIHNFIISSFHHSSFHHSSFHHFISRLIAVIAMFLFTDDALLYARTHCNHHSSNSIIL